jgi:hypothetical protein
MERKSLHIFLEKDTLYRNIMLYWWKEAGLRTYQGLK